jgi:hypothetical protein
MRKSILLALLFAAGCFNMHTPVADIPKLTSLDDVMSNQAATMDPQFGKIGQAKFEDADFAMFADASVRIAATSLKTKDFSKGPEFDAFAMKLNDGAKALGAAAAAKDSAAANAALTNMKAACKDCHHKFK